MSVLVTSHSCFTICCHGLHAPHIQFVQAVLQLIIACLYQIGLSGLVELLIFRIYYFIFGAEQDRTINHAEGSHGVPGVFVKYDLTSMLIRVREEHRPYWQFLVRMCGIVGGVFSVSGDIYFTGVFGETFLR